MRHVQMREAKAKLSALVESVRRGEPVTITRHGAPAAVVVPVEDAERLYPESGKPAKTLIDVLMEFPGGEDLDLERDRRPPREIDL